MLTAPALIGSLDKIKKAVSRKSDKELVFECSSEVASTTFELIPFNRIHFNRYAIYFPLYKQMKDYQAVYQDAWLKDLKRKYKVEINQEVLKTVNNNGSN